jgi:signal transduction histidine kinase
MIPETLSRSYPPQVTPRAAFAAFRPPWADLAIAMTMVALGTLEILLLPEIGGVVAAVCMVGITLPLAWRRRGPLAVTIVVLASMSLLVLGPAPSSVDATVFVLPPIVLALYSVGAHAQGSRAVVGLVLTLGAMAVMVFEKGPDELLFGLVVAGAPWLAGRMVRRRTEQAVALALHAQELERTQAERQRDAVAQERARIARELHDIIAHSVSVMTIQAGAVEEVLDRDPEQARTAAAAIRQTGRQALLDLRRLLGLLREHDAVNELSPQPGLADLDTLLSQVRSAGIAVDLTVDGTPRSLPPAADLSAFRVVQEALTNTLKHATASRASVGVRYLPDAVDIEVVDNGVGVNGEGGGHGLIGMRERITLYGGKLEYGRHGGGGFRVHALLPVDGEGA